MIYREPLVLTVYYSQSSITAAFVFACILAVASALAAVGFVKIGCKRYGNSESSDDCSKYVKTFAKVVGESRSEYEDFSESRGAYTSYVNQLEIEYTDQSGIVYRKFIENILNDGYVNICYGENDPDDFYLSDYADGIAEIENECRGEFVYGISMRIFFGAFAAVFAVISIMTFIHTFNMKTFEGKLVSKSIKVGIVAARFNEFITSKLLSGALDGLLRHEVREDDVHVAWVPGAFEIPLVAAKMAKSGRYDAVICLGAVIRGSTSHYDYVCNEVSKGIAAVSLESGVPVLFGVLTTENIEQAIERAGTKAGNKGYDCAISAIEMVNLLHELDAE